MLVIGVIKHHMSELDAFGAKQEVINCRLLSNVSEYRFPRENDRTKHGTQI